jgi:hypothetical protein
MSRSSRSLSSCLVAVAALGLASPARASLAFPGALTQELGVALPVSGPGCKLCHKDDKGGFMTVDKPFGRAMLKAGTQGGNVATLLASLGTLDAAGTDSDGDGTSDVTELRAGADPNVADPMDGGTPEPHEPIPLPQTGCALSRPNAAGCGWLLVALGVLLASRRRYR